MICKLNRPPVRAALIRRESNGAGWIAYYEGDEWTQAWETTPCVLIPFLIEQLLASPKYCGLPVIITDAQQQEHAA